MFRHLVYGALRFRGLPGFLPSRVSASRQCSHFSSSPLVFVDCIDSGIAPAFGLVSNDHDVSELERWWSSYGRYEL